MGRQWLHKNRAIASQKKAKATGKLVREIMVAAKTGTPDPDMNPRLHAALEKARKESVSKEVIDRALKRAAGSSDDNVVLEHIVFDGYAPHKVPVIVEAYTDNANRTKPEIRNLFKKGQLGAAGSNKFLFDHVGLVEAYHADTSLDREEAAIEAGANEVEPLTSDQNDDIPEGSTGARFITERTAVHEVSQWLTGHQWSVVTSELGFLPKSYPDLTEDQRIEAGEFLQTLEDHEDVHRIWAAVR